MIKHYRSMIPQVFRTDAIAQLKSIVSDFYDRKEANRTQDNFRFPELPSESKVVLEQEFDQKCAYCESKLGSFSPSAIDNFRPQRGARGLNNDFFDDHYWWLAYEWENLYLACPECSFQKATWFPIDGERAIPYTFGGKLLVENPLLIDPCYDDPERHLYFDEEGEIHAYTKKGTMTIEILKLNRESLVRSRREALNAFRHDYSLLQTASLVKKYAVTANIKEQQSQLRCVEIFRRNSGQAFSAIKRQFFLQWAQDDLDLGRYLIRFLKDRPELSERMERRLSTIKDWRKLLAAASSELFDSTAVGIDEPTFEKLESIERVQIKNFKSIKKLDIRFARNSSERAPWLLFLGENGLGKSSVLQAIAMALMGDEYARALNLNPSAFLNLDSKSGYVKIKLTGRKEPLMLSYNSTSFQYNKARFGNYLLAYGSTRLMRQGMLSTEQTSGNARVKNLFDPTIALHDAVTWLYDLPDDRFAYMARSLKKALLLRNEDTISKAADHIEILVAHQGATDTLGKMSDGYKTVVALVVDIMQILERDGATMEEAQGVILVDELETHLHPRWKMRIVEQLRNIFPRVQFIVTSHDPLCLRGLFLKETVVLKREEDTHDVIFINDLPSPEGFRVDQLLTSEFFGLFSTSDPLTENLFNEYYKLLAKDQLTTQESGTLESLTNQLKNLRHFGNTLREELMYKTIDALLAKAYHQQLVINRDKLSNDVIANVRRVWENARII